MSGSTEHIVESLEKWATAKPDQVALRFGESTWTWTQFMERIRRNAGAQLAAGLAPGTRVAFMDKNHHASLETTLGCSLAGTVGTVVNFRLAPAEIVYVLNDSRASVLIVGAEFLGTVESMRSELQFVESIIVVGGESDTYERWLSAAEAFDAAAGPVESDTGFLQLYTSGTTGFPKGAVLTHSSLGAHSSAASEAFGFESDSINMVAMPLFHVGGTSWAIAALSRGAQTVIVRDVVPTDILSSIESLSVTHVFLVPAVIRFVLDLPDLSSRNLTSLRCLGFGGSPMPVPLFDQALATLGVDIYGVYGMTEASGVFCALHPEDYRDSHDSHRKLSAGRAVSGVEARITDLFTGEPLPVGEMGELQMRGAQAMSEYWLRPEATAASFDGEWLKTGDVGRIDEAGYIYIEDRVKDIVISGGENIYPAEVERVIGSFPGVAEVAVIGVPDEKWGESVKAVVVAKPDTEIDSTKLAEYCSENLAGYKRPRTIDLVSALPRNATGKILKRDLRAAYWPKEGRSI
ncbi:long-chain-fatty-acid--CoA ligase [Actinomycetes bacterium M1A6_2h]